MNRPKPKTARDIMVKRVISLRPEMDVFEACTTLIKNKISGAPVIGSDGTFLGIFSEGCCMNVMIEGSYGQLPTTRVDAYMQTDIETITEDTDLLTIAQIFKSLQARRLAVLREGKLVGQISRRDLLKAIHDQLGVSPNREKQLLYLSSLRGYEESPI